MSDELDEQEEVEPTGEKQPDYKDLVTEEPEREVSIDDYKAPKSVSESVDEVGQKSDLQAVLSYLHPQYKDVKLNEIAQSVMASRIFPDNYLDKNFLLVMSLIEAHEPNEDVDFMGLVSAVQDFTSIAYEGRGRVEDLEVAGVAHEEEMEKLTKELGL